ncbi:MAG: sigma-70 family RNA polymerase sigma factor [Planctomycetes bacterium]|nr:sigma-70 family RNA polymerase sigma factor [Planctomycetota bacterium]
MDTLIGGSSYGFPKTVWSAVLNAKDRTSEEYSANIGLLISLYWKPVYRYIRFAWKKSNEDAKDLAQEFFLMFFEKDFLSSVSPEKGRFRTFIKVSLKNFLINMEKRRKALKRSGGGSVVDIEKVDNLASVDDALSAPQDQFDKEWAKIILTRAITILRKQLIDEDKEIYYKLFEHYYLNHTNPDSNTYRQVAESVGLSEFDAKNYLLYARKLMKKIIEKEIGAYALTNDEVEEEIKFLLSVKI